ncbi:MAG TPA: molecular chaperone TorD family protein [Thermoanaerobaculia bacterium]|nr:molecular chaperone TorD family protein [Thermoanaerobaculia bacterium]
MEAEIFRALGALSESPAPELQAVADILGLGPLPGRAAHGELFLFQLYPYASVYLGAEGMMGGEAADRIAGFWRALGQTPPAEPDHLAVMLGLHARLGELERQAADAPARERWRHARGAFLWEHLLSWLPVFLMKLEDLGEPGGLDEGVDAGVSGAPADAFYRRWAALLGEALRAEAATLSLPEGPECLPLHLRAAPGCVDPRRDGLEGFLASLLTPVRSGIVLVRADLARAARELALGLRLGERRLVLQAMFEQDAGPVLGWLAQEAAAWAARHRPAVPAAAPLAAFWQDRAAATARLLGELRSDL